MRLNFNFKTAGLLTLFLTAAFASVIFSQESFSVRPWRAFSIILPEEVNAAPGETVTINGGILNTGTWWMHQFNLSISGLPEGSQYYFSPQYFETVQTLREWNSDIGVYRVPENFTLTITLPQSAAGLQLVTVTGQEFQSAKQVTNSTQFIIKLAAGEHFTIANTSFPDIVTEGTPFEVKVTVVNDGAKSGSVTVKTDMPEDWTADDKAKAITLDPSNSGDVTFTITPTVTSGNVTITAEYLYNETTISTTKVGPMLVPIPKPSGATTVESTVETTAETTAESTAETSAETTAAATTLSETGTILSGYTSKLFENFMGLPLWVIIVAVILVAIILWNLYKILGKYKFRVVRGKPEEMKKTEISNVDNVSADGSESFSNTL